jgi:hypothetical protein
VRSDSFHRQNSQRSTGLSCKAGALRVFISPSRESKFDCSQFGDLISVGHSQLNEHYSSRGCVLGGGGGGGEGIERYAQRFE